MKTIFFVLTFLVLAVISHRDLSAKRLLPQAKTQAQTINSPKVITKGVTVGVKFRSDRNAIIATFTNLSIASSILYELHYKNADNIEQAATGTVDVKEKGLVERELIFGTCSTNNVCRYDTNVHDAKFVVTTILKTGKKVIKTFNLKVKK